VLEAGVARREIGLGKRSCSCCTSASGSLPKVTAQMPCPVAATSKAPSQHCATAKRICSPGRRAGRCRLHAQLRLALGIEATGESPLHRAYRSRWRAGQLRAGARAVCIGIGLGRDAGMLFEETMEVVAAQAHRLGQVARIGWLVGLLDQATGLRDGLAWRSCSGGWSGLQRWQGRKPAASAASRLACRPTFLRKGVRAPQDGLQYTPVVHRIPEAPIEGRIAPLHGQPASGSAEGLGV
jgi:hypothetical protein